MPIPKISIIIPVHNTAAYMTCCLESILAQSHQSFEVICVDDASTDSSLNLLQEFAKKDSRIRVLALKENGGAGRARNEGLKIAQGEYVIFCDSDDVYPTYALETLYKAALQHNAEISGGNLVHYDYTLQYIQGNTAMVHATHFPCSDCVNPQDFTPLWFPIFHPRYLFLKTFLLENNISYPHYRNGEDPVFLAHAFCHATHVAISPEVTYLYRGKRPEIAKPLSHKSCIEHIEHYEACYAIYKEHGAPRQAAFFIFQALQVFLHIRTWPAFSRMEKKLYMQLIRSLSQKKEFTSCTDDFAPYTVDIEYVRKNVRLLLRYPSLYTFIVIYNFFKPKFSSLVRKFF